MDHEAIEELPGTNAHGIPLSNLVVRCLTEMKDDDDDDDDDDAVSI